MSGSCGPPATAAAPNPRNASATSVARTAQDLCGCVQACSHHATAARYSRGVTAKTYRLQAATLTHNAASRKVLERAGFTEIGLAPAYLKIAGAWQDHILYQRILG